MAKQKFVREYDMKSTPIAVLWSYISTANGLKEWFADDARSNGREIILDWNGSEQTIVPVGMRNEKYIRFHWKDDEDSRSYFELRISTSEMTGNAVVDVTDFAEPIDLEEAQQLWDYQMETLQRQMGCW